MTNIYAVGMALVVGFIIYDLVYHLIEVAITDRV